MYRLRDAGEGEIKHTVEILRTVGNDEERNEKSEEKNLEVLLVIAETLHKWFSLLMSSLDTG